MEAESQLIQISIQAHSSFQQMILTAKKTVLSRNTMDSLSCEVSIKVFLKARLQFRQQQLISCWEHFAKFFVLTLWRSDYMTIIILPGLTCYQSVKHGFNFKSHSKSFHIH